MELDIFFWDIDGTLIRTGKAGLFAFEQAVSEQWSRTVDFDRVHSAGMTDFSIARQIIENIKGEPASYPEIKALTRRYEQLLPVYLKQKEGKIMPSVREVLLKIRAEGSLSLLLTGNSRTGAEYKMRHFGLEAFFDFDRSAFCEDSTVRDDVASRAGDFVKTLPPRDGRRVFVIGDTPNDIRCGKDIGALTIAVATGSFTERELEPHDPWWLVSKLPDAENFWNYLYRNEGIETA